MDDVEKKHFVEVWIFSIGVEEESKIISQSELYRPSWLTDWVENTVFIEELCNCFLYGLAKFDVCSGWGEVEIVPANHSPQTPRSRSGKKKKKIPPPKKTDLGR